MERWRPRPESGFARRKANRGSAATAKTEEARGGTMGSCTLTCPIDDGVGQSFELLAVRVPDEERTGARGVVERGLARARERVGRGHAHEGAVERTARQRRTNDLVLLRREKQRHRRGALAQV